MEGNRVAVITGAGSGQGRAAVIALSRAGFDVVLAGRRREPLEETAALAKTETTRLVAVPTDVADPSQVERLFSVVREEFGRVDFLFNNAGHFGSRTPFEDIPFDEFVAVLQTNIAGAFFCSREAFRIMKQQDPMGGRIVNNGSAAAHMPRPLCAAYTASKHGLLGLTKAASLEGRPYNIAVGQLDIGNTSENGPADNNPEGSMTFADVADALVYMANLPNDTNVLYLTMMPTSMPFVGRG